MDIEGRKKILGKIKSHFSGESRLEWIGGGNNNHVFVLERLDSGLYVALRQRTGWDDFPEYLMLMYEEYCKSAEHKSSIGAKVPSFCIGGFFKELPFLLVEDLSKGNAQRVISHPLAGTSHGYIEKDGKFGEEVYFDLGRDCLNATDDDEIDKILEENFRGNSLKYFNYQNRINLI